IHSSKTTKSEAVSADIVAADIIANVKFTVIPQPNPSSDYFTLVITSENSEAINVKVYDMLGRIIESKNNIASNGKLKIGDNYKAGAYIVELQQGSEKVVIRLLKTLR
ncbi:MAG: T9SS type A sorting domain-containing protein, partial [Chitinophagaceae bacterium]